ncbi:MAG TPA: hypothetical protein VHN15_04955, partial [Thermoanaerobaculia bacterium]|nr:hypothetical protein [Thermoanaerobaculia bacterium]
MILGLAAAVLFVLLASVRLGAQGPQYDELHQATGAFTWLGSPPEMFCIAALDRVCVLNTTYSGALKTHLFGLSLRLGDGDFTLVRWRLFGILLLALGIAIFPVLARPALPLWSLAVFLALLLTDVSVLVMGRHDWGPVNLSLVLRLVLLGLWLRGAASPRPSAWNTFWLGALVGIAVFEKLSACLLVLPLAAMVLADRRRRRRSHFLAAAAGVALGAAPLAAVNAASLLMTRELLSLRNLSTPIHRSLAGFTDYLGDLLSLGQGSQAAGFILGQESWPRAAFGEGVFLGAALLLVAMAWMGKADPRSLHLRLAGVALAGYLAVGVGLYLLPRPTWIHHWMLATPFQYVALALALAGLARKTHDGEPRRRFFAVGLIVLATLWLGIRIPNVIAVERALVRGSAALAWSRSLTRLGTFAAGKAENAVFIASDWGVATQIYAFADGRPGLVHEPFWDYPGPERLREIRERNPKPLLYLVRLDPPAAVRREAMRRIERDLATDPSWIEVPPEPEVARLPGVKVRKFLAAGPPGGTPGP